MERLPTHVLAIIGQYLTVREKVTGLMQVNHSCSRLLPVAFAHDCLRLDHPAPSPHSSLAAVARLISHLVYHYAAPLSVDAAAADELLTLLQPTSSSAPAAFPRLLSLALDLPYPKQPPANRAVQQPELPFYRLSVQPSLFPALRSVRLSMDGNGYSHTTWADPVSLQSLQLLPSLRCLVLERVQLSFQTMTMLALLPLQRLDAEQSWLWHPTRAAYRPPSERESASMLACCRVLRMPMTSACDDVALQLLARLQSHISQHPDGAESIESLAFRASPTAAALRQIAGLTSLTQLELLDLYTHREIVIADLSVLHTADMRPALPRLRHFAFPRAPPPNTAWSAADLRRCLQTAVTLLSVYSAQLRGLSLTILSPEDLPVQLQAASGCRRLQHLAVVGQSFSNERIDVPWPGQQGLQPAFPALRSLRLHWVPVTWEGLSSLLRLAPAVRRCRLQGTPYITAEAMQFYVRQQLFPLVQDWHFSPCPFSAGDQMHAESRRAYRCHCHRADIEIQHDEC